jgi:hypothetical protein
MEMFESFGGGEGTIKEKTEVYIKYVINLTIRLI